MAAPIFEFGEFRLDCARLQLRRGSRILKMERKPMELLILLATRNGEVVTRTEIAERLWGSEVFVDTEHGINTAVRKVRHALRDDSEQPRFVQTVTGRGYHFVGPVTLIPADAPFREGEAAVNPPAAPAEQPPQRLVRRWKLVLASLGAVVLLGVTAAWYVQDHALHAARATIHSLAVLPLDNLSGNPKDDYFADGITDEITTMLARDSTLRIISRTSAMQFRNPHQPLREIARSLGVDGIVEGSISRADGRVHMTVQLIRAASDTHLWANSYDSDNRDTGALSSEIAEAIAKRLGALGTGARPQRHVNPEAHDAYLHGRYLWVAGEYTKSGVYYQKATELQPDYALGWSGLADYYGGGTMAGELDPRVALPAMTAAAEKAIALDDTIPQTHLSLAGVYWAVRHDFARALEEADRASQIDPEYAEAWFMRAYILSEVNRHAEAIACARRGMELDPFARPWMMSFIYYYARQYDAAITDASQRLESTPNDTGLYEELSESWHAKGKDQESVDMQARLFSLIGMPDFARDLKHSFEQSGYDAVVRSRIHLMEGQPGYLSVVGLAGLYAQLGQREKTLALLEEGSRQTSPILLDIQNIPDFDFLHKDERYRSVVEKARLPPAW